MSKDLQPVLNIIEHSAHLSNEERNMLLKSLHDAKKELEIESSLERVRTVAMSMNKRDDMLDICRVISNQLELLNVKEIRNVQTAIFYKEKGTYMNYEYYAKHDKTFITETTYTDNKIHQEFADKMLKGNGEFMVAHIVGDEVKDWIAYQKTTNVFIDDYLNTASSLNYYWFSLGAVALGISTYSPLNEEETNLFKRFLKVFELSYRRYLDIEKAEAQAREAQIELSLERVRAKTMAMHNSADVGNTVGTMFDELVALGVKTNRCGILIYGDANDTEVWTAKSNSNGEASLIIGHLDLMIHPMLYNTRTAWKNKEPFSSYELSGEDLINYYKAISNYPGYPTRFNMAALPSKEIQSVFYFPEGTVFAFTPEPIPAEISFIFKRFASVFGQTYRRYLDLQKAEAQAREAQIELALERVRARTMAMQKSDELSETVFILFQQFKELGENPDQATIGVINEDEWVIEYWVTMYGNQTNRVYKFSIDEPDVTNKIYKAWKEQERSLVIDLSGKELYDFATYRASKGGAKYNEAEKRRVINVAFFSKGLLNVQSNESRSAESIALLERFAKVFEQTYTRFLDLQKAEAQAREATIEAALERVRFHTMAMNNSNDVGVATTAMFSELEKLELKNIRVGIAIFDLNQVAEVWSFMKTEDGKTVRTSGTLDMNATLVWQRLYKGWQQKEDFFNYFLAGEEKTAYYKVLSNSPNYSLSEKMPELPDQHFQAYYFPEGAIWTYSLNLHSEEHKQILKKFTAVFSLTFRRYQDLKQAEAQSRESQIQLALERVRARTMAMQKSDELKQAATLLFQQVKSLGAPAYSCGYNIWEKNEKTFTSWMSTQDGTDINGVPNIPLTEDANFIRYVESKQKGEQFFVLELRGERMQEHYQYLKTIPAFKAYFDYAVSVGFDLPETQIHHLANFSHGNLLFITLEPCPEFHDVFKRFAKVFEQTYTRFLDLTNAEAQARESQIEAALERVRSRSMAMQKSEELKEVIQVVYDQFVHLKINVEHTGFIMDYKERDDMHIWLADKHEVPSEVSIPYFDSPHWNSFKEAKEKGTDFFANLLSFEEKNKFYKDLFKLIPGVPEETLEYYFSCAGLAGSTVLLDNVGLYIENFSGTPYTDEENNTLMRFGKVFQQTYTRFNDLQKAEAQALEVVKRASVDRVRAEIASMRTTKDLERITPLIWNELKTLGVPFTRCGVFIMDEEKQQVQTLLSTPDGKAIATLHVPFDFDLSITTNGVEYWRRKEIYKEHWDRDTFIRSWNKFDSLSGTSVEGSHVQDSPENLYLHLLPFLQGMLYVGNDAPLNEEELQLVQNLADAFSTAYARYEDFNKLEAAKQTVEKTLVDLKQAQTQLVQAEKMASLGELTAGIAHEIQNPLNFVNNFSDVNTELIEELKIELRQGNDEEVIAIANDIKANEEKINHHGKRADAIVKGMLQHSRSSAGQKELTDINALADEYLRLAYHGLRAKEKSFNATLKTDFDNSIGKINIIPQDIGRVLLNLYNNAFYAVSEKGKPPTPKGEQGSPQTKYEPTVTVTSRLIQPPSGGRVVEIKVIDNGGGIPPKILDKIFQPFFTTKPTGQGTGLGLSLSYDIIKAHGGEIRVETKEGEGSEFIIQLPIQ